MEIIVVVMESSNGNCYTADESTKGNDRAEESIETVLDS